jgi:hypothetical protein
LRVRLVVGVSECVVEHSGVANCNERDDALGLRPDPVLQDGYLNLGDAPPFRDGTGVSRHGGLRRIFEVVRDAVHLSELVVANGLDLLRV